MAISIEQIRDLDAYWRAANYLTVGQIYPQDNPLPREPLRPALIKKGTVSHPGYIREHLEHMPEVRDRRWSEPG
jgi:xylulose-5-phosphate/fructose-6-phosphate phosphoketolase